MTDSGSTKPLDAARLGLAAALATFAIAIVASLLLWPFGMGMGSMMWGTGPGGAGVPHMGLAGGLGFGIIWALLVGVFFWLMATIYNRLG